MLKKIFFVAVFICIFDAQALKIMFINNTNIPDNELQIELTTVLKCELICTKFLERLIYEFDPKKYKCINIVTMKNQNGFYRELTAEIKITKDSIIILKADERNEVILKSFGKNYECKKYKKILFEELNPNQMSNDLKMKK